MRLTLKQMSKKCEEVKERDLTRKEVTNESKLKEIMAKNKIKRKHLR